MSRPLPDYRIVGRKCVGCGGVCSQGAYYCIGCVARATEVRQRRAWLMRRARAAPHGEAIRMWFNRQVGFAWFREPARAAKPGVP